MYRKTCVKRQLSKRPQIDFKDQLSLIYAGQKCCRRLQGEHSAILSTFIKLPLVIMIFVLSILSGHFTQVYCTLLKVNFACSKFRYDTFQRALIRLLACCSAALLANPEERFSSRHWVMCP